jgi:hypothetical protein
MFVLKALDDREWKYWDDVEATALDDFIMRQVRNEIGENRISLKILFCRIQNFEIWP